MRRTLLTFSLLIWLPFGIAAALSHAGGSSTDASQPPCSDCHVCSTPSKAEPCLKTCLYHTIAGSVGKTSQHGPSVIVMGSPDSEYGEVRFDHSAHSQMEKMGEGCVNCHHYSETGKFESCQTCHNDPKQMGQPGLKGVYHRHCLGCHREWSHSNDCSKCHKTVNGTESFHSNESATFAAGGGEYVPVIPARMVFDVNKGPGKKVTFYHDEHSGKFGLNCNDCHRKQECGACHDQTKPASMNKSQAEVHSLCSSCHENDRCETCHGQNARKPFAHNKESWRLEKYHTGLECAACHATGQRISGLKTGCDNCHSKWNSTNFVHSVTGFEIDDIHVDLDCEDCHTNRRFHDKPDCSGCHDDGRTADTNPPGVRRGITTSQLMPTAEFD